MQPFDFIILKLPNIQGMLKRFAKGSPIIMRYVHHGVVYGFCTEVLSAITAPSPLIFIAYPQQCERFRFEKTAVFNAWCPAVCITRKVNTTDILWISVLVVAVSI